MTKTVPPVPEDNQSHKGPGSAPNVPLDTTKGHRDDEKRAAVGEEFAAVAVRLQLDVATLAAAIAFGAAAGRSLDVRRIAERREQRPVRICRLVPGLREGRSARGQAAECQQNYRADCFQEDLPFQPPCPH